MTETQKQPDSSVKKAIRPLDFESILEDLDNFGLTSVQFRVYCHLLRGANSSGMVSRSSESIASACKLTRITVLRVVLQLERMGMIVCNRAIGKKTVYKLQPPCSWCCLQPVENETSSNGSKVVSLPMPATSQLGIPVNETNTYQEAQVNPFGVTCQPPVVASADIVNEVDSSIADTGKSAPELTLEQKLDAVRQIGCSVGQVWRDGQMEILVDGLFLSVEEFKRIAISSFRELLQPCEAGLNFCRDAIAQIKQKIATHRCNKLSLSLI